VMQLEGMLKISMRAPKVLEMQKTVTESLAMLQLFKPAAVDYAFYELGTEDVLDLQATGRRQSRYGGANKCRILPSEDLPGFWKAVQPILPASAYVPFRANDDWTSFDVAYRRYCEGLRALHTEHRIAVLVIGLEALLSKRRREKKREMLSKRVAELLKEMGLSQPTVTQDIKAAYDVRSEFVHGEHFAKKSREKLTKLAGKPGRFAERLADYLRLCLLASVFLGRDKPELIGLIEGARGTGALSEALAEARPFCHATEFTD